MRSWIWRRVGTNFIWRGMERVSLLKNWPFRWPCYFNSSILVSWSTNPQRRWTNKQHPGKLVNIIRISVIKQKIQRVTNCSAKTQQVRPENVSKLLKSNTIEI
jgi:hypothetical protein